MSAYLDKLSDNLNLSYFNNIEVIKKISEKTKQKPEHVTLASVTILLVFLLFTNLGIQIVSSFFGMLIPAYLSFKSIKTKEPEDDKKWLTYWITFGFFYSFKNIISAVLFFLPLLDIFLTLVLFWIYLPNFNGYLTVYNYVLCPVLNRFEEKIDNFFEKAKSHINNIKKNK